VDTVVRTAWVSTAASPSTWTWVPEVSHPRTRKSSSRTQEAHSRRYSSREVSSRSVVWNRKVASSRKQARYSSRSLRPKATIPLVAVDDDDDHQGTEDGPRSHAVTTDPEEPR
jgi:hypothetical protein